MIACVTVAGVSMKMNLLVHNKKAVIMSKND